MANGKYTRRDLGAQVLAVAAGSAGFMAGSARAGRPIGKTPPHLVRIEARPGALSLDVAQTAVIVIDMQNDFGARGGMFDRAGIDISGIEKVVAPTKSVIASARAASLPIVYLKMGFLPDLSDAGRPNSPNWIKHQPLHAGEEVTAPDGSASRILVRDTWNTDIVSGLEPQPGDTVLYKSRFSGFYRTKLDQILAQKRIKNLVVTGCTTSVCVESTVRDAMFRDYNCLVLEDCASEPVGANFSRTNHDASILTIQALLGWVSDSSKFIAALQG